jgi:hypothetical protein
VRSEADEEHARKLRLKGWGVIPPDQYLTDLDGEFLGFWKKVRPYTMISVERAWALAEAVRHVSRSGIPGDIVECGVWKGGSCLLASMVLEAEEPGSARNIWLYDTFEGMVSPGEEDRIASSGQALSERSPAGWWAAGPDEVERTLALSSRDSRRYVFVRGPVEETLPEKVPERVSVLRLDTDWYQSTRIELEVLFPRLSPGGILIVDDYGHFTGARKAVDEFFQRTGKKVLLHRSDYTGRVIVKN